MSGDAGVPLVDDIVVELADGSRMNVQAKKNHPEFGTCSLRDPALGSEMIKARDQLEREGTESRNIIRFYSRSPFGALHRRGRRRRLPGSRDLLGRCKSIQAFGRPVRRDTARYMRD